MKDWLKNVAAAGREVAAAREDWRQGCGCTTECSCSDAPYARLKDAQEHLARTAVGKERR